MHKIKKLGIIVALPMETQGHFEKNKIQVHYCGIGKINAAMKATELIFKEGVDHILNLGTAGSHKFPTHSLIECTGFIQRDMDLSPLNFPKGETPMDEIPGMITVPPKMNFTSGVCGTGDRFEVGPPELACDLVDMEAYAIAKTCKKYQIGFTSIKYITDGSDDQAHKDWFENIKPGSLKLLESYHLFHKLFLD